MAGDREVTARILIRADGSVQVKKEFDESARAAGAAQKKIAEGQKRLSKAINTTANYIIGGVGAIALYSVKAAMDTQAGQTKVQNALKTTNLGVDKQRKMYEQMNKAADYAATHGGGSAPEELAGLAKLTAQTKDANSALKANAAANNLARGAQIPYAQALQILTRLQGGQTRGIQQYIGVLTPVKTAEQALADAHKLNLYQLDQQAKAMGKAGPAWKQQQMLNAGVTKAQQAQAQATDKQATAQRAMGMINQRFAHAQETMKQKLQDAKHALEITAASMGKTLLPMVTKLAGALKSAADWIAKHKSLVESLGGVLLALAGSYKAVKAALAFQKTLQAIGTWFTRSTIGARIFGTTAETAGTQATVSAEGAGMAWRGFLVSSGFGLIIIAITLMIEHWKTVKKVAVEVAKAVASAVSAAWKWIKNAANDVWKFLKKMAGDVFKVLQYMIPILFIITHFKQIKNAFKDVWNFIKGLGKTILDAIVWPFKKAWEFISKIPGRIFNLFKSGLKHIPLIGGLFSGGGVVKHMHSGGPVYAQSGYGPRGTDNIPAWLTAGEGVVSRAGMRNIGGERGLDAINHGTGSGQNIVIEPGVTVINMDGRKMAEAVTHYTLKRAARGSSSANIGGPMIMGARA